MATPRVFVEERLDGRPRDLPAWMRTEAVPSNGAVFAVAKDDIMRVFERMPITDELRQMKAVG